MKKITKLTATVLCIVAVLALLTPTVYAYTPMDCEIHSQRAVVYSIDADRIVYDKNATQECSIASITKIVTALVTLESGLPLSQQVTITQEMIDLIPYDSSTAGLATGEVYTIDQLLYCLMLPSGNDAAIALALTVSGDIDSFALEMTEKAAEIGCTNTGFMNPHGIDEINHYSTAKDIAMITAYAIKNENFLRYFSTYSYDLSIEGYETTLHHTDKMMDKESEYYNPDIIGSKTGSTEAAGSCLVSYAKRDGFSYITVVLDSGFDEAADVSYTYADTTNLLNTAFDTYGVVTLNTKGDVVSFLPVTDMYKGDGVDLAVAETVTVITNKDLTAADFRVETEVIGEYIAPLAAGVEVGTASFYDSEDCLVGSCKLVTVQGAEKSDVKAIIRSLSLVSAWQYILILVAAVVLAVVIIVLVQYLKQAYRRAMRRKHRK